MTSASDADLEPTRRVSGQPQEAESEPIVVVGLHGGSPELGLRHSRHARATIEGLGNPPDLLGKAWMYEATTRARLREWDEAEAAYRHAIDLVDDVPRAGRTLVAALGNLGMIQGMRGDYEASIETLETATRVAIARLGAWHPSVIKLRLNLTSSIAGAGRHADALQRLVELRPGAVATLGPDHADIGRLDHNRGVSLEALDRFEEGYEVSLQALLNKRAALGPDHMSVANTANNVADALANLDRPAEAIPYYQDALRIWGDGPDRFYGLHGLADVSLKVGEAQEAVRYAREALLVIEGSSSSPRERGRLQFTAARAVWQAGGDHGEARSLAEQAKASFAADKGDWAKEAATVQAWLNEHPTP